MWRKDTHKTPFLPLTICLHRVDGTLMGGHGGGDEGIVNVLYDYLANDYDGDLLSEIGISVENHLTVFAAEKSRLEGTVVDVKEFAKQYLK